MKFSLPNMGSRRVQIFWSINGRQKKLYPPKPHIWLAKFDTSKDIEISSTTKIWSIKTSTVILSITKKPLNKNIPASHMPKQLVLVRLG